MANLESGTDIPSAARLLRGLQENVIMDTPPFRVTLDDRPITPSILSLEGRPDRPASGDVLEVDHGVSIVLETEGDLHLRRSGHQRERFFRDMRTGEPLSMIACRVMQGEARSGSGVPSQALVNPLTDLSPREMAALRGIRLDAWDPILEYQFAMIDTERCVVSIGGAVLRFFDGALPPPPRSLRYLILDSSEFRRDFTEFRYSETFDFSGLARLPALRAAVIMGSPMDLGFLSESRQLRLLHVSSSRVSGLDAAEVLTELRSLSLFSTDLLDEDAAHLAALTRLRLLSLYNNRELSSVEFSQSLRYLEYVNLNRTGVQDLTPLGDLPALEEIHAVDSQVRSLPERHLPRLRRVDVMNTPLAPADVSRFRELNPEAVVRHGWLDALREATSGTDRVRVRSEGTCHRDPAREITLIDESDPAAIEDLIRAFGTEDPFCQGGCLCCGHPTIEFRRRDDVLVALGLHHGMTARWEDWPGDAHLLPPVLEALSTWLSQRGETSFRNEFENRRADDLAMEALEEECLRVLPPETAEVWRKLGQSHERADHQESAVLMKSIRSEIPDPIEVLVLAFRLLGCGVGNWDDSIQEEFYCAAMALLEDADPLTRGRATTRAAGDPDGWEGVVLWLFSQRDSADLPPDVLDAHFPDACRHALSDPWVVNRWHALVFLARRRCPISLSFLRDALNGIPIRERNPRHFRVNTIEDFPAGDGTSISYEVGDVAFAARLLARLNDRQSYRTICERASTATEPSRAVLLEAKAMMDAEKVVDPAPPRSS